jgi:hypothetical protein
MRTVVEETETVESGCECAYWVWKYLLSDLSTIS